MDPEREYPGVVIFAVEHLMDMHKDKATIGQGDIDKVVQVARALNPDIVNEQRADWLRRDVTIIVNSYWETLKDRKNRGRRDEIIRGALR